MKFDTATINHRARGGLPDDNACDFVRRYAEPGDRAVVKFDMGTATKITMLAVFGHNLTSVATVTLQANATDSWGAPSFSMALTWHARCIAGFINQTYRWWRITIEDGSNPAGYVEIGRVCAGEYYEPGVNVNQEIVKKLVDPSYKQESEGRQGYAIEKEPYRTIEVYFSGIDRSQQNELETMFRAVRRTRPVFASS
jgi:hypothetical protein